jgi:hypothetical protein
LGGKGVKTDREKVLWLWQNRVGHMEKWECLIILSMNDLMTENTVLDPALHEVVTALYTKYGGAE